MFRGNAEVYLNRMLSTLAVLERTMLNEGYVEEEIRDVVHQVMRQRGIEKPLLLLAKMIFEEMGSHIDLVDEKVVRRMTRNIRKENDALETALDDAVEECLK